MKIRFIFLLLSILAFSISCDGVHKKRTVETEEKKQPSVFIIPDTNTIPQNEYGELVRYGRQLILNTAYYIGPNGVKGKYLGNKMNCTNCHLDAGTRPYGLNYFSTHARYPQYRARENRVLSLAERVNNCIERPHSGKPMPLDSKEMTAIISYIKWIGSGVPTGEHVEGDKGIDLVFYSEPADTIRGAVIYNNQCKKCHGENGEGKMRSDGVCFEYPPLWGDQSYPPGSSMFRVIKMAQFVRANMPHGTTWKNPVLSDKEALDVAAFVNSTQHKRPVKKGDDYPNEKQKPIDHFQGPYDDPFSAFQHKYGPFQPIVDYRKKNNLVVNR